MSKSLYIFLTLVNFFASHGSSFSQPFDTTSAGSGSVAPPASIGRTTAFTYLEVVSCPERMVDIKVKIICKKMQNASKRPHFGAMKLLYNEVKTVWSLPSQKLHVAPIVRTMLHGTTCSKTLFVLEKEGHDWIFSWPNGCAAFHSFTLGWLPTRSTKAFNNGHSSITLAFTPSQ